MFGLKLTPPRQVSVAVRYGVVFGTVAGALVLSLLFRSLVDPNPFILFFGAVAISAWFAGLQGGLLATFASAVLTSYFLLPPPDVFTLDQANILRLLVFSMVGALISLLSEARRRAETRFAVTLSSIGDAVLTTDTHSRITFMNAVAEALTGWRAADAQGQDLEKVLRIVNEHTRQPVENPITRVLREGRVIGLANHTVLIAKDGTEYPIDDSGAPITDIEGNIIGAVMVFRDISERKHAEVEQERLFLQAQAAQREAEAARVRLHNLFMQAPALIAMLRGRTGVCELFNPQFMQLWGYRDVIGKPMREAWPELEGQGYFEMVERVYDTGETEFGYEYPTLISVHNDGTLEQFYFNYTYQAARDGNGAIEGVLIYGIDVTTQVRSRQAIEQAAERIRRLQEVTAALSRALTPAQVAEIVLSQGLSVVGAQAGMVALTSSKHAGFDILGSVGFEGQQPTDGQQDAADAFEPLAEAVQRRAPVLVHSSEEWTSRYPVTADQARDAGLEALVAIPMLTDERLIGGLSFAFGNHQLFHADETAFLMSLADQCMQALERARLYEAEQQARATAEAAVRIRDVFLSVAAHELKTPLTSLLGHAELLQRRSRRENILAERYQRSIDVITSQTKRLNSMVLGLLDVARMEQGQLSIEREAVDLVTLAQRIVEEVQPTLHQHTVVYAGPSSPLVITGDEVRLEQVLQNLIQNAIKYTPQGGPVVVQVSQQSGMAYLSVSDKGIGIPADGVPRLFQRYYRADNPLHKNISGMGVGLHVVKEIITLHGGTIAVESVEGEGSTFTVCLPLRAGLSDMDGRTSANGEETGLLELPPSEG